MNKQKNQETNFSFDTNTIRRLFQTAKANRVIINKSDGSQLINVSLLVAVIVTLIVPELVAVGERQSETFERAVVDTGDKPLWYR